MTTVPAHIGTGRLDHVGVVVSDTVAAIEMYGALFGLKADPSIEHAGEGVRITFLRPRLPDITATTVELLEPTRDDTGIARYLAKRGEGMHHICFEVDDVQADIARLTAAGYEILDKVPRRGMHGERLAFIHPRSGRGVLTELYERGSRQPGHP